MSGRSESPAAMSVQVAGLLALGGSVLLTCVLVSVVAFGYIAAWTAPLPSVWLPIPGLLGPAGMLAWVGGLTAALYRGLVTSVRTGFGDAWIVAGVAVGAFVVGGLGTLWVVPSGDVVVSSAVAYGSAAVAGFATFRAVSRPRVDGSDPAGRRP